MTIQELREKRSKAWDTARDFLDSKRNESGLLSEEDSKTYDAMEQQIVAYGKEIQRLERQAQIEAEMNKPTSTPIQNKPNASIHIDSFHDYELCILAKYLRQIPQFASDLDDAFIAEHGLTVLMDVVRSLPPLDTPYVPRDSIVREFVGGSIFQY